MNQKTGARQGAPNPTYYKPAAAAYGKTGTVGCNSQKGKNVSTDCIFYDITLGDMDVNCTNTHSCYRPGGSYGVLSTSDSKEAPAYGTGKG